MLHEFIKAKREEIIRRCKSKISSWPAPRATNDELGYGLPLFLDQITETLRNAFEPSPTMAKSAAAHGAELLRRGFTIAQVVHDYGGVCQTITALAVESAVPITASEFKIFNLCLDEAIAGAVTEYGRLRDHEGNERLGQLAHELGNFLSSAFLAFEVLKSGSVGVGGSTATLLGSSLRGMRDVISRELAEVRLGAGIHKRETVAVRDLIEDVEIAATIEANERSLQFSVVSASSDVLVSVDRQLLASAVTNLLQNAFKFTRPNGHVILRVRATQDRLFIDVEDQCGGLPAGTAAELFAVHEQRGEERSGLGLGLSIAERAARANGGGIRVRNDPGAGCVFTVELPRLIPTSPQPAQ